MPKMEFSDSLGEGLQNMGNAFQRKEILYFQMKK